MSADMALRVACLALLSMWSLSACNDLSEFRTSSARVFRGTVVGSDGDSFIRRGFPAGTELELTFDPALADGALESPGALTTREPTGVPTFDRTPLLSIAALPHDALSEYELPGPKRVRNYIFVARPEVGPLAGRDATVFLSLLRDGAVEVRVIAGPGEESAQDRFGVFPLRPAAPR